MSGVHPVKMEHHREWVMTAVDISSTNRTMIEREDLTRLNVAITKTFELYSQY